MPRAVLGTRPCPEGHVVGGGVRGGGDSDDGFVAADTRADEFTCRLQCGCSSSLNGE